MKSFITIKALQFWEAFKELFIFEFYDEIVHITSNGSIDTIDIETDGDHLFYANSILTHNSAVDTDEYTHANIAGGISKINTADNVIGIRNTPSMRERGEVLFEFLKTRNSTGVGSKVKLKLNIDTMAISDFEEFHNPDEDDAPAQHAPPQQTDPTTPAPVEKKQAPIQEGGLAALKRISSVRNAVSNRKP